MVLSVLRFNFASPQGNPSTQRELINAAIELAEWGDTRATAVSVDEHHVTGHTWRCNPTMAASLFLTRTRNVYLSGS